MNQATKWLLDNDWRNVLIESTRKLIGNNSVSELEKYADATNSKRNDTRSTVSDASSSAMGNLVQ